jgi:lipopolysaccharide/colanic/teichoic acid biosynthesis glycosyltransferase
MSLTNQRIAKNLPLQRPGAVNWPTIGHSQALCGTALILADCAAILLTAIAALSILSVGGVVDPGWTIEGQYFTILCVALVGYFALKGRYSDRIPFWTEAQLVVCASLSAFAIEAGLGIIGKDVTSRIPILVALIAFPPLAISANYLAKSILSRAGTWIIPVVVVGDRQNIEAAEAVLKSDMSLGFGIVGRLDPNAIIAGTNAPSLKTLLSAHRAKCLFIATDGGDALSRQVIERALRERIRFATLLQPYPAYSFTAKPTCFFSHDATLLSFQNGLSRPLPRFAKSAMDILVALVVLIVTSPALIAISLAIMMDGGPVLFRQLRVGAGGRPFYCFKFRTMVVNADQVLQEALAMDPALAAEWTARRKLANDPRITRLGRFLRQTSLDELPQLINVLRLDMSLVGPRPIVERNTMQRDLASPACGR